MKIFDIIKEDGVYWDPDDKAGNVGTENPFGKPQQSTVKAASGQAASKNNSSDLNLDGPYYAPDNNAGTENPFGQPQQSTVKAAQQTAAQQPAAQLTKQQQIQHVQTQLNALLARKQAGDRDYKAKKDAYTKLLQRLKQR